MSAEIQLIDFTRTGCCFNAYLVTPDKVTPCEWGQIADMTRAEAIKLARSRGFEPTIRHAHQVWLRLSATAIAKAGYEAHDLGLPETDSPWCTTSANDMAWRAGWHMAARGYMPPSLNDRDAVKIGRGSRVHVRDQLWSLRYDGDVSIVERVS